MKIGLFAIGTGKMAGGGLLRTVAADAERVGVATLWVPEHVVLLDQYASKYPYSTDGALPAQTNAPIFDPFISLATMAAATTKIRLATGICLVIAARSAPANVSRRCANCGVTRSVPITASS
jgi:alkanesulfonate monooxygenase SsuD/methylene tetrahydromethanopterin reductase-like flavin-dependent oxidoreductase (luciferase family)